MTTPLSQLTAFLDNCFSAFPAHDPSNNGLQVEGKKEVAKAAFAVDACAQVFRKAAELECDFIFCHHGLSWGGGLPYITGITAERIKMLLNNGISLYATHLPLDAHPDFGNNAQLAQILNIDAPLPFGMYHGAEIGFLGTLHEGLPPEEVNRRLSQALGSPCTLFATGKSELISKAAIISGGGAEFVQEAADAGADCLITGEMLHQHYHEALELGIHVISGGHYATETVGPRALMHHIAKHFPQLQVEFIDVPTGL